LATGMFPTKDPTDMFGHDLEAIDKLELDIDFSLDVLYHESFTFERCQNLATQYADKFSDGTISQYGYADGNDSNGNDITAVVTTS